jgi:hypothetical protein
VKVKQKLKTHFKSLEKEYEKATSFQLSLLQPYLSYLQLSVDNNDNNCLFGFGDSQNAFSAAVVHDTIPFMKTAERMTNPCFHDTEFAIVMKGKHVIIACDETAGVRESGGEVSGCDKETVDELNQSDSALSQHFHPSMTESGKEILMRLPLELARLESSGMGESGGQE